MSTIVKLQASERVCNATANTFSNAGIVRVVNKGAAVGLVTLKDVIKELNLTINASANATTLLTLGSGNTDGLSVGLTLYDSTNVGVINTGVVSVIASIVNSTAITSNVDIIVASGDSVVYAVDSVKTVSVPPSTVLILEKNRNDTLISNNNTDMLAAAVSIRG